MADVFTHRFRIRLHDTDAAGVLFFGHLFRYAHDAYETFMTSIGYPLENIIADGELLLPVTHAEADYREPLRHAETVEVAVEVVEIRRRSFVIAYRFRNASGTPCVLARTVHVQVRRDGASGGNLAGGLRAALTDHLVGPRMG